MVFRQQCLQVYSSVCVLLLPAFLNNAKGQATGRGAVVLFVFDSLQKPLDGATALLYNKQDSLPVQSRMATAGGRVQFTHQSGGRFFVTTSMVGYMPFATKVFELTGDDSIRLPDVHLREAASGSLSQVVITARKLFMQKLPDRTIVNVETASWQQEVQP